MALNRLWRCSQVNLFQMFCLAAVRFTLLVEMLPFVNSNTEFFYQSVREILAKTESGVNRCLRSSSTSDAADVVSGVGEGGRTAPENVTESTDLAKQGQKRTKTRKSLPANAAVQRSEVLVSRMTLLLVLTACRCC